MKQPNFGDLESEQMGDLHLQISSKYMAYKELADRCLINLQHVGKGDRRVFYLKPASPFLKEPTEQNRFRHEFVARVGQPPLPEQLTLMADDIQKGFSEKIRDKSEPTATKQELANYFRRRQYQLQHKRYKLLLRWAHFCLTSDLVDKVSLKFSPAFSKIQFELENCVKRFNRLDGEDHFGSSEELPAPIEEEERDRKEKTLQSVLRPDDIDIYLRCITYEERIAGTADKFVQRAKWVPLVHRFEVYKDSVQHFQEVRRASIDSQL